MFKDRKETYPKVIYVFYSGSLIKKPRKNKTVAMAAMQQNKKINKNEEVPKTTLLVLRITNKKKENESSIHVSL